MSSRSSHHHSSSHKSDKDRHRRHHDGSSHRSDDTRSTQSTSTARSDKTARPSDGRALVPLNRQYHDDNDDIESVKSYATSRTSRTGRSAPEEYYADEYNNGVGDAASVYSGHSHSHSSRRSRGGGPGDDAMSMRSGVSSQPSAYSGRSRRSQAPEDYDDYGEGLSTMSDLRDSLPDYDGRSRTSGRTGSSGDDVPFNKIENALNRGKKISVVDNCPRYVVDKNGKERNCTWCNGTGRCSVARKQ
ncbi:hypothetical protein VMCG_08450 [Cytospora schulzeri]|uniref:Uncharacterized protein n=1 Tax=Cytospora schulzeri TaxID=448051 RepID=A0A423VWU5_9PEZI|nr:hypothetical protein VMCG_08450 [Valsa malicola]